MNKFEELYKQIILEANWDFGEEFKKKGQYKNIAIYFSQQHLRTRIKERGDISFGDLYKSCEKFLKTLIERNQLLKDNQIREHYNVYDTSRQILYCCDLVKKRKDLFLKVNTFLEKTWKTRKVYEI